MNDYTFLLMKKQKTNQIGHIVLINLTLYVKYEHPPRNSHCYIRTLYCSMTSIPSKIRILCA